eukprot:CAMPEP_0170218216 /NCGR_PEP_ID=MMETSP0116_2-20130129/8778_1 /TAXON_ID=400756 /ORGANISM="Durinskia baltica, Strain CSIRO CS-38" /LENGTH=50 /DNA_ID=CAMNT_0010468859 /DNA_START=468 /DNA_END=616 /DNA_ORIENTATION=+
MVPDMPAADNNHADAAAKTMEIFAQCRKVRSAENHTLGSTRTLRTPDAAG